MTDSFVTSILAGSLLSFVSSRNTSYRSGLFQIISLSGCTANNYLAFVVDRIWYFVILVMLDPKNTSLSSESVQILCTLVRNLRSPPAIISSSCDQPRVISALVALSHWSRMSSITDFLSAMSLSHSWDLVDNPWLWSKWWCTWGYGLEIRVSSTVSVLIGLLPDGMSRTIKWSTTPSFTWCLDERCLLIEWSDKKSSCVGSVLVLIISEI